MSIKVFKGNNKLLMRSGEKLYLDTKTADINFIFDIDDDVTESVPAHKIMLSAGSPVFEAMFYGSLKEPGDVKIVDASPDMFKEFLQFFYMGIVQLTSDNVFVVTTLCHKYEVMDGLALCETAMVKILTIDTMCSGYAMANLLDLRKVSKRCEQKIAENPDAILKSNDFLKNDQKMLAKILELVSKRNASINAATIIDGCIKWAKNKCEEKNVEATAVNLREEFGSLVGQMPFAELPREEFAQFSVTYKGLFNNSDFEAIILSVMMRCERIVKDYETKMQSLGTLIARERPLGKRKRLPNPFLPSDSGSDSTSDSEYCMF